MSSLSYADVQNLPAAVLELLVRGYLLSSVQSAAYPNGGAFGADVKAAEGASPSSGEVPGMTDWGKPTGSDGAAEATGGQNRGARARRRSQRLAGTSDLLTNGDNEDRRGAEFVVSGVQRGASGNFGDEIVRGATEARSEPRWDPRAPEVLDAAYVRERVGVLNVGELRELLCALGLKVRGWRAPRNSLRIHCADSITQMPLN